MIDFEPAATEMAHLLDGVREEHLGGPTPCANYSVAALLDHIAGLSLAFIWAGQKLPVSEQTENVARPGEAERLNPEWRTVIPQRLAELAQVWREPAAWEGMTEVGGLTLPAETMAIIALDELVVHGWDLARATGQPFRSDPGSTAAALAFTSGMAQPGDEARREGRFGPVVEVPADASDLDRALGFSGRDPAWTPNGRP
jgi:uncharacterized protein (TIGR03086 family)